MPGRARVAVACSAALVAGLATAGAMAPQEASVPAAAARPTTLVLPRLTPRPAITRAAAAPGRGVGVPRRLVIPAAGIDAPVIALGLLADGTLATPGDVADAGWWDGGARPGARGPAVIVGHVDSKVGPAVFFRLGLLRRGDVVRVIDAAGRTARFTVARIAHVAKARFPTAAVYGATAAPELRLITCSGAFDAASGHYLNNTIVFARLSPSAGSRAAGAAASAAARSAGRRPARS